MFKATVLGFSHLLVVSVLTMLQAGWSWSSSKHDQKIVLF